MIRCWKLCSYSNFLELEMKAWFTRDYRDTRFAPNAYRTSTLLNRSRNKIVSVTKSNGNRTRYKIVRKSYAWKNRTHVKILQKSYSCLNPTEIVRVTKSYRNCTRDFIVRNSYAWQNRSEIVRVTKSYEKTYAWKNRNSYVRSRSKFFHFWWSKRLIWRYFYFLIQRLKIILNFF